MGLHVSFVRRGKPEPSVARLAVKRSFPSVMRAQVRRQVVEKAKTFPAKLAAKLPNVGMRVMHMSGEVVLLTKSVAADIALEYLIVVAVHGSVFGQSRLLTESLVTYLTFKRFGASVTAQVLVQILPIVVHLVANHALESGSRHTHLLLDDQSVLRPGGGLGGVVIVGQEHSGRLLVTSQNNVVLGSVLDSSRRGAVRWVGDLFTTARRSAFRFRFRSGVVIREGHTGVDGVHLVLGNFNATLKRIL